MPADSDLTSGPVHTRRRGIGDGLAGLASVLVAYLVLYAALLVWTNGYPYGLDNNESYSSWWHARSLYENGIAQTKGLTDEVFATHPAASPYIHSHQGNFPRLFTFLLYALGARSIESQIWITTFTVGLAAMLLAFRFLSLLGGTRFATVACLVLQSNYLLFAQWQVSLYNVWHAFFFFSSLLCVQHAGTARRARWFALTALNFAALFYWEYVFTAFVVCLCALYAIFLHGRHGKILLLGIAAIATGAAIAAGTLLLQLTAYMGWEAVMEDVRLTLTARNTAADPALLERVTTFYREHRIIFWHNFLDAGPLRTWSAFWSSLYGHQLAYYSRPLLLVLLPLITGWLLGAIRPPARSDRAGGARRLLDVALLAVFSVAVWCGARALFGIPPGAIEGSVTLNGPAAGGLLLGAATLLGAAQLFWPVHGERDSTRHLMIFFVIALVAYAFTYRIFTGYVFSGYLHRLVPLLVFATDLVLALGVILLLSPLGQWRSSSRLQQGRAALSFCLLTVVLGQWVALQLQALRIAPPDAYQFLRVLDEPRFRHRSLVSNTYPAPMAARTKSWGYADTVLVNGYLTLTPEGFQVDRDTKYRWFADAQTNPAYPWPDLAILVRETPNIYEAARFIAEREAAATGRAPFQRPSLVRRALTPFQPFVQHRLLYSADERAHIVDFDWDFPPYLLRREDARAVAAQLNLRQKLELSAHSRRMRGLWRIEWEWLDSPPATPGAASFVTDAETVHLTTARSGHALVAAPTLQLALAQQPASLRLRVTVNDVTEEFDLARLADSGFSFEWQTSEPHGRFTRIPTLAEGLHVRAQFVANSSIEVSYRFMQQQGAQEAGTLVRVYAEEPSGKWRLADAITFLGAAAVPVRLTEFRAANPDTLREYAASVRAGDVRSYERWLGDHLAAHPAEWAREGVVAGASLRSLAESGESVARIPVASSGGRPIQVAVTPGTATKRGTEYFALPLLPGARAERSAPSTVATASDAPLPFGKVKMRLRFPPNRWPQAEPILVTGHTEAADIIYVIYTDERHIQIGFDHWFRGGPLTKPIPIDFSREHELVISMGSLYPPREDLVFVDQPDAFVRQLKDRVVVRLDGETIIDAEAASYESDPRSLKVGRNDIRATSCNPLFMGEILEVRREWPDAY